MQTKRTDILQKALKNKENSIPFVLATVVEAIAGTPGRSGFKMLVYQDSTSEGTVGGGLIEQKVICEALKIFHRQQNKFLEFDLSDSEKGIGMVCGGTARVFLEFFPPRRQAFLFGAGHLCQSLLPLLNSIDFHTIVIDERPDYASKQKFPNAGKTVCSDYLSFITQMDTTSQDAIIIFTHAHEHDFNILLKILQKNLPHRYLGMIASRSKAEKNLAQLRENGIMPETIKSIHSPIGLNIAKTTTQEIAISIAAELLAVYNNVNSIKHLAGNH